MDLDGRTRQFFSVLSERLKEKGFSSRIADDGCLAVKSKKMRGKEQTQCSVGKDGEVLAMMNGFLSGSVALCCCMGSQPAPETNQKSEERSSTNESQTSM